MSYTLNAAQAKQADSLASSIKESGKYIGTITRAEALLSRQDTRGLGLSFRADDDATADYLDLYTHNASGEELPSLKVVQAIMACLRLRNISEGNVSFERWNRDTKQRERVQANGYPDLMGKRIGFLLRKKLETNEKTGDDVERIEIFAVFQADTDLTATEVLESKTTPERLPKMVAALAARPVIDRRRAVTGKTHAELKRGAAAPDGGTAFDDMDSEIPF